jgi:hypothetical protein
MIVLAVDTATKAASAALIDNGEIRSEFLINNRTMHSRNLMPLVEEAVKAAGIKKSDIDLFASTVGPGSFTGVRIGVATVKAMAYALKKPVVGINTLDCLAFLISIICTPYRAVSKCTYLGSLLCCSLLLLSILSHRKLPFQAKDRRNRGNRKTWPRFAKNPQEKRLFRLLLNKLAASSLSLYRFYEIFPVRFQALFRFIIRVPQFPYAVVHRRYTRFLQSLGN